MIIVVKKIGAGTELDPIRPDITEQKWRVIEEYEDEFAIEILD